MRESRPGEEQAHSFSWTRFSYPAPGNKIFHHPDRDSCRAHELLARLPLFFCLPRPSCSFPLSLDFSHDEKVMGAVAFVFTISANASLSPHIPRRITGTRTHSVWIVCSRFRDSKWHQENFAFLLRSRSRERERERENKMKYHWVERDFLCSPSRLPLELADTHSMRESISADCYENRMEGTCEKDELRLTQRGWTCGRHDSWVCVCVRMLTVYSAVSGQNSSSLIVPQSSYPLSLQAKNKSQEKQGTLLKSTKRRSSQSAVSRQVYQPAWFSLLISCCCSVRIIHSQATRVHACLFKMMMMRTC